MCAYCGQIGIAQHDFAIVERPAETLAGLVWEGSYADAAAGAIRPLIERMKASAVARADIWSSDVIGISWNDRPDGFRYFVGLPTTEDDASADDRLVRVTMPALQFANAWHGPADGDVVAHYGRMLDWMRLEGRQRDVSQLHHREEYPAYIDLSGPPVLRLMMPVVSA